MNLEQFDQEQQERIREHLNKYESGRVRASVETMDDVPTEVLLIRAETLKEAKAVEETATLMGHYSEWSNCSSPHDCSGQIFSSVRTLKRVGKYTFIAIHRFGIDI